MLEQLDVTRRGTIGEDALQVKAKNGSRRLLSLLRKYHGVVPDNDPKPVELISLEPEPVEINEPVKIVEPKPIDPIKAWVERQKSIPIKKAPWFRVEKDIGPSSRRTIQVEDVIKSVAKHYGVSRHNILSARRTANLVRPRQVVAWLCKELTLRSLPEIGRRMNRDHTTILHSIRRVNERLAEDNGLADEIAEIKREILA